MNLSPVIHFAGNKEDAKLLKSQALQFYNFEIESANRQGIGFISRTKTLPDGSSFYFFSRKEDNYNLRTGKIVIFSPPSVSEESSDVILYVTVLDKDSVPSLFPVGTNVPYQTKKNRFLYGSLTKTLKKLDFYSGGIFVNINAGETAFTFVNAGSWFSDKLACSWNHRSDLATRAMIYVKGEFWEANINPFTNQQLYSIALIDAGKVKKFYPSMPSDSVWCVPLIFYNTSTKVFTLKLYALGKTGSSLNTTLLFTNAFLTLPSTSTLTAFSGLTYNALSFCYYTIQSGPPVTYTTSVIEFTDYSYTTITNTLVDTQPPGAYTQTSTFTYTSLGSNYTLLDTSSTVLDSPSGYTNLHVNVEKNGFAFVRSKIVGNNASSVRSENNLSLSLTSSGGVTYSTEIWGLFKNKQGVWEFKGHGSIPINTDGINSQTITLSRPALGSATVTGSIVTNGSNLNSIAILYCSTEKKKLIHSAVRDITVNTATYSLPSNPLNASEVTVNSTDKTGPFIDRLVINGKLVVKKDVPPVNFSGFGTTPFPFVGDLGNDSGTIVSSGNITGRIGGNFGNVPRWELAHAYTEKFFVACGDNNTTNIVAHRLARTNDPFTVFCDLEKGAVKTINYRVDFIPGDTKTVPLSVTLAK